jgi:hypothetical protein
LKIRVPIGLIITNMDHPPQQKQRLSIGNSTRAERRPMRKLGILLLLISTPELQPRQNRF